MRTLSSLPLLTSPNNKVPIINPLFVYPANKFLFLQDCSYRIRVIQEQIRHIDIIGQVYYTRSPFIHPSFILIGTDKY